jgi:hypothetical protein
MFLMKKWIFCLICLIQIMIPMASAEPAVTSNEFNTLINEVSTEQLNTAHILWNAERVKDYLRRRRTLQNVKTMIAENESATSE